MAQKTVSASECDGRCPAILHAALRGFIFKMLLPSN